MDDAGAVWIGPCAIPGGEDLDFLRDLQGCLQRRNDDCLSTANENRPPPEFRADDLDPNASAVHHIRARGKTGAAGRGSSGAGGAQALSRQA